MVESQLRPNRIDDRRLLDAMREVPRERFLPKLLRGVAYADEDLPLPGGGHLIEPLALARLIQAGADPAAGRGAGGRLHHRLRGRGAGADGGDRDPAAARSSAAAEQVESLLEELAVDNVVVGDRATIRPPAIRARRRST